ncbi:MAG: AsmA family protein [Alistipes sp.]|jgi:hypothetical protein|nr:AsmA family protein [Alistipes sp.]
MKKFVKITLISLGSLVGLALLVIVVALWVVFTPARLTSIVEKQLPNFVTCEASVERVELTFFSSFPRLGLQVDGVALVNAMEGAPSDTLLSLDRLHAAVDVRAFLRRDELRLSDVVLSGGTACLFTDEEGRTNYDIVKPAAEEPAPVPEEGGFALSHIDLNALTVENLDILYVDRGAGMDARLPGISLTLQATMDGDDMAANLSVNRFDGAFSMGAADHLSPDAQLAASVENVAFDLRGTLRGEVASVEDFQLDGSNLTVAYGGETYLSGAPISINVVAEADLASQKANIRTAELRLHSLPLSVDGTVSNDSLRNGIDTDLHYRLADWPVEKLLSLVPPAFAGMLEGIEASGLLSSEGTVKGLYAAATAATVTTGNDAAATTAAIASMPTVDANVTLRGGNVRYPAMLPWPLTGVEADLDILTDLTDEGSKATVNSIEAHTPRSSVKARGTVSSLLSDPRAILSADLRADLADAKPFLPTNLKAAGRVSGRVNADARMSQLTNMRLDRMRLSGSLLASNLDATYDTIAVKTPSARVDFSLPNSSPTIPAATFASLTLTADKFAAQMGADAYATLDGTRLELETSNVMDTERTPAVRCDFAFANLAARMDDMSVAAVRPSGTVSMEPGRRGATQRLRVAYNGGAINGKMAATGSAVDQEGSANDIAAALEKLNIDATVVYDPAKEELWRKFIPRGKFAMEGFTATVPSLDYPVEVPTLAMDFTPRTFNIDRARVKLDESDFSLDGTVHNIVQYFRGDSILRAEFNFDSPVTNVSQLLALTSGIGGEEPEKPVATNGTSPACDTIAAAKPAPGTTVAKPETPKAPAPDEFSGPWMVPQGIDLVLNANIGKALWEGEPLFSNVNGEIWIRDGAVSITPQLTFDSPVTHGVVQLLYRTPDRNNLFAGVSIHLSDIEMQELISLVPDLDKTVPMLRSFSGKGEFHAAAEGYMDSTYRYKMSTMRAAASIAGTDLALKDEEMLRQIAFLLKYKDEGAIRVDSMRAELTVFRNEVDVYPFLMKVDRYGVVIGGRHNLDMSFDYNISLVESPLPFRVAVDVKGTPDDPKFKVFSKSRYPDFYRPRYEGVVESREMELRNIIRGSLISTQPTPAQAPQPSPAQQAPQPSTQQAPQPSPAQQAPQPSPPQR